MTYEYNKSEQPLGFIWKKKKRKEIINKYQLIYSTNTLALFKNNNKYPKSIF